MSDEKLGEAQGRAERLVSAAKTSYRDKRGNGPRKDTQISLEAAIFAARGSLEDKPRIQESSRDRAARVANERRSLGPMSGTAGEVPPRSPEQMIEEPNT